MYIYEIHRGVLHLVHISCFLHVHFRDLLLMLSSCIWGIHFIKQSLYHMLHLWCVYDYCYRIHSLLSALYQLLALLFLLLKVVQEIHPQIGASCLTGILPLSTITLQIYLIVCDTYFASKYKGNSPLIFTIIPLIDLGFNSIAQWRYICYVFMIITIEFTLC